MSLQKTASIKVTGKTEGATAPLSKLKDAIDKNKTSADKAGVALKKMATDAAKVGAVAIGAAAGVFKLVDSATKTADQTIKAARAAGVASDAFQRLAFSAGRSGIEADTLAKGLRTVNKHLLEASHGGGKAFNEALADIGLSFRALEQQGPEAQLGTIADALNKVDDESRRTALAMEIFGKAGPQMASLLASGSKGIKEMSAEAERLGLIMSEDTMRQAEAFQDALSDLKVTIKAIARDVGLEAMPVIRQMVDQIKEWIVANRDLIRTKIQDFVGRVIKTLQDMAPLIKTAVELTLKLAEAAAGLVDALGPTGATGALIGTRVALMALGTAGAGPIGLAIVGIGTLALVVAGLAEEFSSATSATEEWFNVTRDASGRLIGKEAIAIERRSLSDLSDDELRASAEWGVGEAKDELARRSVDAMFAEAEASAMAQADELIEIRQKLGMDPLGRKKKAAARGGGKRDPHADIAKMLQSESGEFQTGEDILGTGTIEITDADFAAQEARLLAHEQMRAEIQLNERMRALDIQREAGVDPITMINAEEQAKVEFLEGELARSNDLIEQSRIRDQIEQEHHEARLQRMRAEQAKAKEDARLRLAMMHSLSEASIGVGASALRAALEGEVGVRAAVHSFAKGKAIEMTILAATETARGIAALASPFTAAAAPGHFIAAGQAGAAAALIGTVAGVTATGGGGGSRSVPSYGGSGVGSGGGSSSRSTGIDGTPISRSAVPPQSPKANAPNSAPLTVHFHSVLPPDEEKAGLKLKQLLKNSNESMGDV